MFVTTLERRAQNALSEKQWETGMIWGPLGGYTGREVTPAEALRLTTVYSCVSLIAEDIGALPFHVYRLLQPRGRQVDPRHAIAATLQDPNPEITGQEYWESVAGHLALRGNSYAHIVRTRGGGAELWPLRPDRMQVVRMRGGAPFHELDPTMGGELAYVYSLPSGEPRRLRREEVLHIRGFGSNGVTGYSRIGLAREAVAMALAAEEYAARFFGSAAKPSGVLQLNKDKKELSPDALARLRSDWNSMYQGLERAQRVAILEEGTTWQAIGMDNQDAQFLELRQFQRTEIAALFRVPPFMVGDVNRSTSWGTGIEQQALGYVTHTLLPYLTRIERRIKKDLLTEPTHFAKFTVDALLRGDAKSRAEALAVKRQNGIINANEWRELDEMNPVEGGEEYWRPANMAVVGEETSAAPPSPAGAQRAAELAQLISRMDSLEGNLAGAIHSNGADR